MASDPSIYAQVGKTTAQPYNALTGMAQVAKTGNALMQGRQLQMQVAGRNALQQAYQNVPIDPRTGLPDSQALISNLQRIPGGGLVLPDVIQGLQKQQATQFELNKAQLDQTTARTNVVNGALAPLMRMGSNVTPQDVMGTIAGLHASGLPTDEFVQDAATTLPVKQPGVSDAQYGQQLQSWIVNHAARAWPAAVQADKFTPNVATVDTGGNIITRDVNPYTNPGIASAAPIGKTFTPGEQASQVPGPMGPLGQKTVVPQGTYASQNGMGNLVPGGAPGQPSPFANGGRLPSALLNRSNPQAGPATQAPALGSIGAGSPGYAPAAPATPTAAAPATPVAAPAPGTPQFSTYADQRFPPPGAQSPTAQPQAVSSQPGAPTAPPATVGIPSQPGTPAPQYGAPMVVGMGPGQTAGATAAGDASAKQWAALQSSVGGSAGRLYRLDSALRDLQGAGPTGPSSGTVNNVKSYLLSLPVVGQSLGIDANQVANYDMANKYLTAYASARAGRFGGTTDSQLATTLSSNASTHISGLAAQDVVKANVGLERADQAQLAAFQQGLDPVTGQPTGQQFTPDQFADYSSKWNTSHDLRAYVADKLTPQQFGTMLSGMSPADQTRFQSTFNAGISQGLIDPPTWMQPPAAPASGTSAAAPTAPAQPAPPAPTQAAAATPAISAAAAPYAVSATAQPAIAGGM